MAKRKMETQFMKRLRLYREREERTRYKMIFDNYEEKLEKVDAWRVTGHGQFESEIEARIAAIDEVMREELREQLRDHFGSNDEADYNFESLQDFVVFIRTHSFLVNEYLAAIKKAKNERNYYPETVNVKFPFRQVECPGCGHQFQVDEEHKTIVCTKCYKRFPREDNEVPLVEEKPAKNKCIKCGEVIVKGVNNVVHKVGSLSYKDDGDPICSMCYGSLEQNNDAKKAAEVYQIQCGKCGVILQGSGDVPEECPKCSTEGRFQPPPEPTATKTGFCQRPGCGWECFSKAVPRSCPQCKQPSIVNLTTK